MRVPLPGARIAARHPAHPSRAPLRAWVVGSDLLACKARPHNLLAPHGQLASQSDRGGSCQAGGQDLASFQLMGVVSLAELAHHCHPGEALIPDLQGSIFDLGLTERIDLLAPEVDGTIQDDALAQSIVPGIGSRPRYEHQGYRIGPALGDHIGDEGGEEDHPLHLGRVLACHQLIQGSQQAFQEIIGISWKMIGLDHLISVHDHGVGGGAAKINSYQHFHSPFGMQLGPGGKFHRSCLKGHYMYAMYMTFLVKRRRSTP